MSLLSSLNRNQERRRSHAIGSFVGAVSFLLAAAALTFAQGVRGAISGTVTDPNGGAAIVGANIELIISNSQLEIR